MPSRQPPNLDIGSLRKQVAIQSLPTNQAKDVNWNEPTDADWATLATVWGSVEPLSGRELVFAAQVVADASHLAVIRYYPGVTTRMRLQYVDDVTGVTRTFNIDNIKDVDERHVKLELMCHEAPAGS